jgi:hypothetical protein
MRFYAVKKDLETWGVMTIVITQQYMHSHVYLIEVVAN